MIQKDLDKKHILKKERKILLKRIDNFLEPIMIFFAFVWLLLLVIELIWQLPRALQILGTAIWILFIIDFLLKFLLAPEKLKFLKGNIITLISLFIPALRFLRIARFVRFIRLLRAGKGLRLLKVISSINRGIRTLSKTMQRRAFGYVSTLTLVILFLGAAGMFAFEKDVESGLQNYWQALWWTAMLLTSMGSEYWPKSTEGQTLCFILAIYGFAVFGYFTAFLASYFLGQDAQDKEADVAGAEQIKLLHQEVSELKSDLKRVLILLESGGDQKD